MRFDALPIAGCFQVTAPVHADQRGRFTKPFVASRFAELGLRTDFVESYHSTSEPGVIRGMHFQLPPHDHAKYVYCVSGGVLDVLLDLRRASSTFGVAHSLRLEASSGGGVYIASGVAHGFLAVESPAHLVYSVTSEYAPAHDTGIRWDSFGFDWNVSAPVLSARDAAFPALADFQSPF